MLSTFRAISVELVSMETIEKAIFDSVWQNARILTMSESQRDLLPIEDGLIAARNGKIVWLGTKSSAPKFECDNIVDCQNRLITPGLIDCHTHLVYGGSRADEFEQRLLGKSYEEIARSGGGIISTVKATRAATKADLIASAQPRLDDLIKEGITTIEIKSGYGLNLDAEIKMLEAARELAIERNITIKTTLLAAHALPPEFANSKDAYIDYIIDEIIPKIAELGLADTIDGFCENIGFSPKQIEKMFIAAKKHGFALKLHAEQLSNQNGAALAAKYGALSADHLEHLEDYGISEMAKSGTVAVLLPGAYYFTRETKLPPIEKLRQAKVPMAIATDCNPGTSPLTSILLAMNMAATLFRMTVYECISGTTREAARALGILGETGTLEIGKNCDLAIWDIQNANELVYNIGKNPLYSRVWNGKCQ